jgi:prolyl 4-hydroxylase
MAHTSLIFAMAAAILAKASFTFPMAPSNRAKLAALSAITLLLAIAYPYLSNLSPTLFSFIPSFPFPDFPLISPLFTTPDPEPDTPPPFTCHPHAYRTELISLSPLIIYIHSLITPAEISSLLSTASPLFAPSAVSTDGQTRQLTPDRTSQSAGLPRDDPAVLCVLNRARNFMGTMLRDGWDEMGPPQLVRYGPGEKFNIHHDWFVGPRRATDGTERSWNRVASFFAVLEDNCTAGETHFPFVEGIVQPSERGETAWAGGWEMGKEGDEYKPLWREHEDGGLAFRPVAGNAIFWVNLHPNGTGDMRTVHAGLPLGEGRKTAMNIWPRQYYP